MSGHDGRDEYFHSHHRSSSRPRMEEEYTQHRQILNEPYHSPRSDSFRHERYDADLPRYLEFESKHSSRNSSRRDRRRRHSDEEDRIVHVRSRSDSHPPHHALTINQRSILKNPLPSGSNVCCVDYPRCHHPAHEESDYEDYETEEEYEAPFNRAAEKARLKKMRNKALLYAGLASITTIAASNNIYQSTKASMARRDKVEKGEISVEEARKSKDKALMMDLMAVGVACIGINNARKGWKRLETMMQDNRKAEKTYRERRKEEAVEKRVAEAIWDPRREERRALETHY